MRESIAILAWLDQAWPDRPIWGETPSAAATIWQDVMLMENDLRPAATAVTQALMRRRTVPSDHCALLTNEADRLNARLTDTSFLGGATPMAADIWLYPTINWIARGVVLAREEAIPEAQDLVTSRPALKTWVTRMAELPGVKQTYPPHWRD